VIKCLKHDFTKKTGRDDPLVACGNNGPIDTQKGNGIQKNETENSGVVMQIHAT
jgi:hypothetical protein